ncbi:anthranilate phosphoribosyltransferase [Desulfitispora alkaliphila]|uniref:anthranilate phosphoribosyltransferase n=1 Tax=Desulfitispora alkaliphila TaxID=622674 RepID=UPI003D1E60D9
MLVEELIGKVVSKTDLTEQEADFIMNQILSGSLSETQITALVVGLKMKGESQCEIVGFVNAMRQKAKPVPLSVELKADLVDTCGTGGDGKNTFNVSTAVTFVLAAAGLKVAKHGNRSVTSKCGSADVLEKLGVNIHMTPRQVAQSLERFGFGFMFAQDYHSAMSKVAPVRRELKMKTAFNILGPLSNPANTTRQLVGVYSASTAELVVNVLKRLNLKHACVVHSNDGLDEISIGDTTNIFELKEGKITSYVFNPENLGIQLSPLEAIAGGSAEENAKIIKRVFSGQKGACRDMVVVNSAFALYIGGMVGNLKDGKDLAEAIIDSGKATKKLNQLIEYSSKESA